MPVTAWPDSRLGRFLAKLARQHGNPRGPKLTDPFHLILWEIVAYLADDARRQAAFDELREKVGLDPEAILAAPLERLVAITRKGGSIAPGERAERLQIAARLVREEFGGDLRSVLKLPFPKAKRALMSFPMIGEPGAEKILLLAGVLPVLALDSNGLRVLLRAGFGEERKSYSASYKSVREATLDELPAHCGMLARAHSLLRQHGQQVCLRNDPVCHACSANTDCRFFMAR